MVLREKGSSFQRSLLSQSGYGLTCTLPDWIGICGKSSSPINWQALGSTTLSKKIRLIVSFPPPGSPLSKTVKKAASNSSLNTGSLVFLTEPPKLALFPTTCRQVISKCASYFGSND